MAFKAVLAMRSATRDDSKERRLVMRDYVGSQALADQLSRRMPFDEP